MPTAREEWRRGYSDGFRAGMEHARRELLTHGRIEPDSYAEIRKMATPAPKKKRKVSADNLKYSAAFRKLEGKYNKKNGSWREGGYKACVKAAHKLARK